MLHEYKIQGQGTKWKQCQQHMRQRKWWLRHKSSKNERKSQLTSHWQKCLKRFHRNKCKWTINIKHHSLLTFIILKMPLQTASFLDCSREYSSARHLLSRVSPTLRLNLGLVRLLIGRQTLCTSSSARKRSCVCEYYKNVAMLSVTSLLATFVPDITIVRYSCANRRLFLHVPFIQSLV